MSEDNPINLGDALANVVRQARYNPFRPNSIVPTGAFAGRYDELTILERILNQTKNGNPEHFLITGERGIGKSSLLFYIQCVADGTITTLHDQRFNFLVLNLELDDATSYASLITKIGAELTRVVSEQQKVKAATKSVLDFLSRWEAFGIKYRSVEGKNETTDQLLEELCLTLQKTVSALKAEIDGILILIDEADKPTEHTHLGTFSKLLTERLVKQRCFSVALGLAGLPRLIDRLRASHESSLRVFCPINLGVLQTDDRKSVIQRGLEEAHTKNGYQTQITDEALDLICNLSEGYPHFIQQFAYSAFNRDSNNIIDADDVREGAYGKNGALQALAVRYFNEWYFDKIESDEYRQVLNAMAAHEDGWVTKKQIRDAVFIKESTLANALTALKSKNIIQSQKGKPGTYKLPNRSFAVWIRSLTAIESKS